MPRKQKDTHYIYKTTCLVTGRYYIGMHSTSNIDDGYLGSGKRLRYSIRKHGEENHVKEILEYQPNRELLIEREKEMITSEMITDNNCMNLKGGGDGGFISEEQQRHRSKCAVNARILKEKTDTKWLEGYKINQSAGQKKAYKDGKRNKTYFYDWTDKKQTKEHKNNISKAKKGKEIGSENSQYGTCWITKDDINKKIKKEEVEKFIKEGWVKGRKLVL